MELIVCGNCGFLGTSDSLIGYQIRESDVSSEVVAIIRKNSMSCKCCPSCGSAKIFYKNTNTVISSVDVPACSIPQVTFSEQPIASKPEEEDLDPEVLKDILDSVAPLASVEEPKKKDLEVKASKKEVKANRVENTKARFKKKCDICNQDFESKDGSGFATRCPKCIKETMKKYVG